MDYLDFIWTDDRIEHLAQNGITHDDFEHVMCNPIRNGFSRSSGRPAVWGNTLDGRYIIAVYEKIDDITVFPITAYEVSEPS